MTTKLLPPTEFPARQHGRSNPDALKQWQDFLAPKEIGASRALREAFAAVAIEFLTKDSPLRRPVREWSEDEFMDYALNADYPADIEERIEESWRR